MLDTISIFCVCRKGGYEWKGQDYRYPYIKQRIGPVAMGLLNLTVIAPFQDTLLLLMVTPLYMTNLTFMADDIKASLHRTDLLAAALFFFFLVIEMTADEQQYRFQTEKHCLIKLQHQRSGDYQRGFLTSGLFRFSRHANFFAEMGIWWSIYLFSVGSAGWLNWTIIGPFTLTLLFQGSTWLTEVSL